MPASSLTLWSRLSMIGGLCREAGSCTTAIEGDNTSPSDTPSAWRRPASSPRWVASATRTTMLSPKPSTASTRPRSSIGVDHGAHARPSSSPRSNGSTGSTIAGCWNPSATSHRPKLRSATTPGWMNQPWPRDSNETASDQPGAVQFQAFFREHQPPTLIVWGKNDNVFPASGAEPYLRDLPKAELHLIDSGHFALE